MRRAGWIAWWIACLVGIPFLAACDDGQSGVRVPVDPHSGNDYGMTSYCLGDGSGMRVYERQFPTGGTQPLFSVVYTGAVIGGGSNPAYCRADY